MTPHEEDRYHRRVALFHQARGMQLPNAQQLAERLFDRDRDHDDRHTCIECAHLRQPVTREHWGQWQRGAMACGAGAAVVDVECLHRCTRFKQQTPPGEFSPVTQFPIKARP